MRHTIHIMYGVEFKQALLYLKEYLDKSGTPDIEEYCSAFLLEHEAEKFKLLRANFQESEIPSITNRRTYIAETVIEGTLDTQSDKLLDYLRRESRARITQERPGDYPSLNIIIHCPLYKENAFSDIEPLLNCVKDFTFDIDILGFDEELKDIFMTQEEKDSNTTTSKELSQHVNNNISNILDFAKKNPSIINHLLIWSNVNYNNVALGISNIKDFVRVVGEFTLLCVENYRSIFGDIHRESIVHTFGLSMLSFDRFYFVEYLANRTYMSIMDREEINQDSTSINRINAKAKNILEPLLQYFSNFYKDVVKSIIDQTLLNNPTNINEVVINKVEPIINEKIEEMKTSLINYFDDTTNNTTDVLTLPEKKALLATILGEDDELLVNNSINNSPIIFDDIEGQFIEYFVKLNNSIIDKVKDNPELETYAVLSDDGVKVSWDLNRIKELKLLIKKKSSFIRTLEDEKTRYEEQISNQRKTKKTLIKDGSFVFNDQEYKLLPVDIQEKPLQETYCAHPVTANSIDLRESFPDITSQGKQGACTAFALTSIYEYFFNRNNQKDCKLSQSFLYYNARKKRGNETEDSGSAVSCAIETMAENGMCRYDVFPYNEQDYLTVPPQDAYDDGATRKVKKALNVNIALEDIKSALSEGYPIAISTTLYESFGSGYKGLVSMPTAEEIEQNKKDKAHGGHAMVICGYNDKSKLFIVRNSWGTSFGDNGYCYMPYEYVLNENLTSGLYIITEIATCEIKLLHTQTKYVVEFDKHDSEGMYNITKRYIEVELEEQKFLQYELDDLTIKYNVLKQSTKDYVNQDTIREGYIKVLNIKHEELIKEKQLRDTERAVKLDEISLFRPTLMSFFIIAVISFIGWKILPFLSDLEWDIMNNIIWWGSSVAIFLITFVIFNYLCKKRRREITEEYDDILIRLANDIGRTERDRITCPLKVQIFSTLLIKINEVKDKLYTTLNCTKSYLNNLQSWYAEMAADIEQMDSSSQQPFTSLLTNQKIDEYFNAHKSEIAEDISLSKYVIEEYKLASQDIIDFKKKLDSKIADKIASIYSEFSMDSYLLGQRYEYLEDLNNNVTMQLEGLDHRSSLFYPANKFEPLNQQSVVVYLNVQQKGMRNWLDMYPRAFMLKPGHEQLNSAFKLILLKTQQLKLR